MDKSSYPFAHSILKFNIFSVACLMLHSLVLASDVLAGRPLVIDDASPVPEKHVELEVRLSHIRPNDGGREQRFRYLLAPQIVLDAAAGQSFRPTGADFQGTAGLTWTFDVGRPFVGSQ